MTHKLCVNNRSKDVFVETVDEGEDEAEVNDHEINEERDGQPNPNVNPDAAKKTFLKTAMEDVVITSPPLTSWISWEEHSSRHLMSLGSKQELKLRTQSAPNREPPMKWNLSSGSSAEWEMSALSKC